MLEIQGAAAVELQERVPAPPTTHLLCSRWVVGGSGDGYCGDGCSGSCHCDYSGCGEWRVVVMGCVGGGRQQKMFVLLLCIRTGYLHLKKDNRS